MSIIDRLRAFRLPRLNVSRESRPALHGAAPLIWCVLLTAVGVAALVGSTWMLLVFVAGSVGQVDWASSYKATESGVTENTWHFEATIHWLVGVGLFLFCAAIAIFNATWLEARKHMHGLVLHAVTAIGCVVALFMISGAIVVQQRGSDARDRDVAVAAQTAQVGVSGAETRLNLLREDLARLQGDDTIASPSYQMQACRAGARGWAGYITQARGRRDPRLDQIERAMNSAQECDRLKAERETLAGAVTVAQVQAVTVSVAPTADTFMHRFTRVLEDIRKPVTATLGELLAMTAFGFALASWRTRQTAREQQAREATDEAHMIPDFRDEPSVAPQPMDATREVVRDAETGEELVRVTPRAHWRRKKGQRVKTTLEPTILPDEKGVRDSSEVNRAGSFATAPEFGMRRENDRNDEGAAESEGDGGPGFAKSGETDGADDRKHADEQPHNTISEDENPAPVRPELPAYTEDDLKLWADEDVGLGVTGDEGVMVKEDELEGAK